MRCRGGASPAPWLMALLLALPGPATVAADTCACDPIQPFLVVDRFDETHVTYRHADNPGIIYASNKTGLVGEGTGSRAPRTSRTRSAVDDAPEGLHRVPARDSDDVGVLLIC